MKQHLKTVDRAVYRLSPRGTAKTLLHCRSTGHYAVPAGWKDRARVKPFFELFWCVGGELEFCCGNDRWLLHRDEVCFYLPGDLHRITATAASTEYLWLTIDGPDLAALIEGFGVTRAPRNAGCCPVPLFAKLDGDLRDWSAAGEFKAGAAAYEILSLALAGNTEAADPLFRRFRDYVERNYQRPDAGIERCAALLRCHRSTLMRVVKSQCGISPLEYLISFRMQEALRFLNDTTLSIKEISERCGFSAPNYFAKALSRRFGKNPSQLRT